MSEWWMKGEVGEYLIDAVVAVEEGRISEAVHMCLEVGMTSEEIYDDFIPLSLSGDLS